MGKLFLGQVPRHITSVILRGAVHAGLICLWGLTACSSPPETVAITVPSPSPEAAFATPTTFEQRPALNPTGSTASQASPTPAPTQPQTALPSPETNPLVIGYSAANRPIEVHRFGNGARKIIVVAGIHGGYEWNTTDLAQALIAHIQTHAEFIPPGVTLYVLPLLNPDGAAASRGLYGRANANGVDLNRNWPARWQATWDPAGCWNYLPLRAGDSPASEPETQALMQFLQAVQVQALVSYHSAGGHIFAGGQPGNEETRNLAQTLAASSGYAYPPPETGCVYSGQLIDWAAEHGMLAVDVELSNHTDTDLTRNLHLIQALFQWGS